MADKIEEWFNEAKKDGLHPETAKWAFRLARARGVAVVTERLLRSLESVQAAVDYAIIAHPNESQRQIIMTTAPHPEQLSAAREDFARSTEMIAAAELILELARPKPPALAVIKDQKARFTRK